MDHKKHHGKKQTKKRKERVFVRGRKEGRGKIEFPRSNVTRDENDVPVTSQKGTHRTNER